MKKNVIIKSNKIINLANNFNLTDGEYVLTLYPKLDLNIETDISVFRKLYFYKLKVLGNYLGYTKNEIHNIVKNEILLKVFEENEEYFITDELSTTSLTSEGWYYFIMKLDEWSFVNHNVIL